MDEYLQTWDHRHWFFKENPDKDLLSPHFIAPRKNLFAQLGNYCNGHEFVTEQTPYADRALIDMKYREPPSSREYPDSIKAIKLRDLKHRILGQSVKRSFQCRVVQQAGGFVANCPINWGWKVAGGYSPGGCIMVARPSPISSWVIGWIGCRVQERSFSIPVSGGFPAFIQDIYFIRGRCRVL
jgi:hypothetical protein